MQFALALKERAILLGKCSSENIEGCTKQQIEEIMKQQSVEYLPPIYIEFLKIMGVKSGTIFGGSDTSYNALLGIKQDANELLSSDNLQCLPHDAYVCLMHQGYYFLCFRTQDEEADPEVHEYRGNSNAPKKLDWKLSQWLTSFIETEESSEAQELFLDEFLQT